MTKRILSVVLSLVMVLSLLPAGLVTAEGSEHIHCMCGQTKTKDATCADCGTKAVVWTGVDALSSTTAPGNYYFTKNISVDPWFITSGEYAFCLCGHNLTSGSAGKRIIDVAGEGVKLTLTDCGAQVGSVTGATGASATGSALCVSTQAQLNLYNIKVTGNKAATNGVILVARGGTFNMYSGQIVGNETGRGAIYVQDDNCVANLLGGTITGNHAKNTGNTAGGGGVYGMKGVINLGGDIQIVGNTSAGREPDLYIRNDQGAKLQLSTVKPMVHGAKVRYNIWTAETDTADLKSVTGAPAAWSSSWLRLNGTKVGYAAGKFFLDTSADHIHCMCGEETVDGATCASCGTEAVAWTGTNTVPVTDGYYYLTESVKTEKVDLKANVAICLNEKNLESASGATVVKVFPGYSLQLTDCGENVGSVTGVTATTAFDVQSNAAFTLWNGKITGNKGTGNGTVWVAQGTATLPGATFTMYGGEISGNTTGRGAVFTAVPSTGIKLATVRLLGGKITGNKGTNTSASTGSGAGVYALTPVEIGGTVQIYGNDAAIGPDDVFLRNDSTFTGKLTVSADEPLASGANVNYDLKVAETDNTDLKAITGSPAQWDKNWVTYAGAAVYYADGKFSTQPPAAGHVHCMCGAELTLDATCGKCGTKAVSWTGVEELPTDTSGYYYLTDDWATTSLTYSGELEVAICLNGKTLSSKNGYKVINVDSGASVSVADCCGTPGKITGSNKDTYGLTIRVNAGSAFNLWNGKIAGNTGSATGDGVIYVDQGTATVIGGTFNMYGGEISGNTVRRGTVYSVLSNGVKAPVVRILGGTITGNHAFGTGSTGGGGGIIAFNPVEVGGDAKIYGNTAALTGGEDIYLRNDYNGSLVVSQQKPLADGAKICYGAVRAEADPLNLIYITGQPAAWNMEWVSYDGVQVGYEAGRFYTKYALDYADHDHDNQKWVSVKQGNGQLPGADGYYVLESDVTLPQTITVGKDSHVHLCLNGYTLTAASNAPHFDVLPGGKLTICDCTAKTAGGVYTAGKITGGNGATGGSVRVRQGAEMYLIDGIFTGNVCAEGGNGGVMYLDGATADQPGAIFKMTGGQMCGNKGTYGGAVRLGAATFGLAGPTFIMEGGSICHNESSNYGGAIHGAGGADIQLKGGLIANNTAANGGGAISVNSQSIQDGKAVNDKAYLVLSGTTIQDNAATTWGGNIYIKSGTVMTMTGGVVTGGSAKVGAGILLESKDTTLNMSGGKIIANRAGAAGAGGVYASTGTVVNLTDGEIANNTAEGGGGGMTLYGATARLTGGTISGNTATSAGGLCIQGAQVYLGKVTISNNTSSGSAGGVYISRASSVCSEVVMEGTQILGNTCKASGGGIFLYMNGNVLTMNDGLIADNRGGDGGAVVAQREVTFTLNGGQIKNNKATSNCGGVYASIDSTFIMNGGTISGNYTEKNGGGVYCLRSKVSLNGGTITGNKAKSSAGGVMITGATVKLAGTTISYNSAEGSGGGVMVQSTTQKVDGVSTRFVGRATMTGGSICYNTTPKAAAGLLVQAKDTVFDLRGGSIHSNTATKFSGGVYVGKDATFNMYGGSVANNISQIDAAGGIRVDNGIANIVGGTISGNQAAKSAGGIMCGGAEGKIRIGEAKIFDNEAKVGGGIVAQGRCDLVVDGAQIYRNKATQDAGGVYISTYTNPTFKNSKIYENTASGNGGGMWSWATSNTTVDNCEFTDNVAGEQGGAIWTRGDAFYLNNSVLTGNKTEKGNGGAVYAGMMGSATPRAVPCLQINNTTFHKNESSRQGGALFVCAGAELTMDGVTFTENKAVSEAGAFWAKDEVTMRNITATGNISGGEGFAIYLAESEYDGQTFFYGLMKIAGNMKVYDNKGGDLYLGEQTAMVIMDEGLGKETKLQLTLHSGVVTQWVWGSYNYEGGDRNYTITYGELSLTNPEQIPAAEGEESGKNLQIKLGDVMLYAGVGVFALVVAAAVVILLLKKKKAPVGKA